MTSKNILHDHHPLHWYRVRVLFALSQGGIMTKMLCKKQQFIVWRKTSGRFCLIWAKMLWFFHRWKFCFCWLWTLIALVSNYPKTTGITLCFYQEWFFMSHVYLICSLSELFRNFSLLFWISGSNLLLPKFVSCRNGLYYIVLLSMAIVPIFKWGEEGLSLLDSFFRYCSLFDPLLFGRLMDNYLDAFSLWDYTPSYLFSKDA